MMVVKGKNAVIDNDNRNYNLILVQSSLDHSLNSKLYEFLNVNWAILGKSNESNQLGKVLSIK